MYNIEMKKIVLIFFAVITISTSYFLLQNNSTKFSVPSSEDNNLKNTKNKTTAEDIKVLTTNLNIPWSLDFLPDGRGIFTQRPGNIRILNNDGQITNFNFQIPGVKHIGEGGLLGIAVDPKFSENKFIFIYYTYSSNGENTLNRVVRYEFKNNTFTNQKVIVDQIPGGTNHNGGRLKFGPDEFLYIATGDAGDPSRSQDKNSLAGKILRVDRKGKPASDNPFNNSTYSYGHRNPQGISWNSNDQLYETEHGPLAHDEINRIIKGGNYGWPIIQGMQSRNEMISPIKESGIGTWAPSGTEFYSGSLFYAGLRGNALYEAKIENESVDLTEHFRGEFGRIRDVVLGPDNLLYILTNNTDGRGNPSSDDDKIIRINPDSLK